MTILNSGAGNLETHASCELVTRQCLNLARLGMGRLSQIYETLLLELEHCLVQYLIAPP